jgi:hypothetical protein
MAIGDAVNGLSSVANNAYLDIQPGTGFEYIIHNLYFEGAVEMYFSDGTNNIKFDSDTAAGGRLAYVFHSTNSKYLRIKNVSGTTKFIGFDGIQSK